MKELLKKYLQMTNDERDELEELYLIDELIIQLEEHEELELSISDLERILEVIKKISYFSHIGYSDIIERILKLLEIEDISTKDIEESDIETLLELLEENEEEFEEIESLETEMIKEIWYKGFYCCFIRCQDGRYVLAYAKDEKSDQKTLDEIMIEIIDNILNTEGE